MRNNLEADGVGGGGEGVTDVDPGGGFEDGADHQVGQSDVGQQYVVGGCGEVGQVLALLAGLL